MAFKMKWLLVALVGLTHVQASGINTVQIVSATMSAAPQCLRYQVRGICFWLNCIGPFCSINTTLDVSHYLPDVFASVYNDKNSNPWDIGQKIIDPLAYKLGDLEVKKTLGFGMGWGQSPTNDPHDLNTHFKEVDMVGNPALYVFNNFPLLLLPTFSQPFQPYYSSLADASLWRSTWTELFYPASLIPGMHEVGSFPLNDWGAVYPRSGFLNQMNDAKAAAVFAQRSADIVTRTGQPHVYVPLRSGSCGQECNVSEAEENNPDAVQWQMVYPIAENSCRAFGENDVSSLTPWGSAATQKGGGNYVWVLWRHYQGCIQGQGTFIGKVGG